MQQDKAGEVVTSYYGIDLHKDQITWHCIHKTGNDETVRENGKISTDRVHEELVPMLTVNDSYLIVEASGSSFFFYSLVEAHCKKAFVVNPVAFRELYMTGKKTDRIDAKKLAERLKYHIECGDGESGFPEVFVPDADIVKIRKMVTAYELIVKQGTQIKNQAKAIFRSKMIGVAIDIMDKGLEDALKDTRIDDADRSILNMLKRIYDTLMEEKEEIKKQILLLGSFRFRDEVKLLISIPGISLMSATVFMADICTVERFSSEKKMTSYLASVGTVDSSGSIIRNGGLSRRGRRTSYRFILQGLEHIVNGNKDFQKFKERHALTRSNKVRAAIVRKTFVSMYFMLKNKELYRYMNEAIYERKIRDLKRYGIDFKCA